MTPPQTALSRAQDHLNGKGPYLLADADLRALVAVVESVREEAELRDKCKALDERYAKGGGFPPREYLQEMNGLHFRLTAAQFQTRAALRAATASGEASDA